MLKKNETWKQPTWLNLAVLGLLLMMGGLTLTACQPSIPGGEGTEQEQEEAPQESNEGENEEEEEGEEEDGDSQADDDPE